jgi:hypothetical protein
MKKKSKENRFIIRSKYCARFRPCSRKMKKKWRDLLERIARNRKMSDMVAESIRERERMKIEKCIMDRMPIKTIVGNSGDFKRVALSAIKDSGRVPVRRWKKIRNRKVVLQRHERMSKHPKISLSILWGRPTNFKKRK